VDKDKKNSQRAAAPPATDEQPVSSLEELFRSLQPEMRRPKPGAEAVAAAVEAAQRLAAETDAEQAADDLAQDLASDSGASACAVCGHRNRPGNKFCAMCGVAVGTASTRSSAGSGRTSAGAIALPPRPPLEIEPNPTGRPGALETHHYHHHYHHHYFPGGQEGTRPTLAAEPVRDTEKFRPNAALRGDMSRAEAAVRRITHEWVLACNTKHLDDLLDLYVADALVLRSNYPPVRGAAAVREFFFAALDAGLGEVEVEPLRVDVVGDLAYEAGRCKALVPGASGKRREERGKYLWVCARQSNGEWKLAADCWSSDLTLTTLESDVPASAGVKTTHPRKNS
jgi:ketosteroid isomerase-like protein